MVYLATDVESTIQPFKSAFGDALLYREGGTRSADHGIEIHFDTRKPANNLAKGVLLDFGTLCGQSSVVEYVDQLCHITSHLSLAAAVSSSISG